MASRNDWIEYERRKREIINLHISASEYEEQIKNLEKEIFERGKHGNRIETVRTLRS